MSTSHDNLEALLEQALAFSPEERAAFLAGACGNDEKLRQRLEVLLAAHEAAGDFLPTEPGIIAEAPGARPTISVAPITEQPGNVIGRYKLLEKVGEGGFGVVYVAEQREPVKRRVALKIIKLGMDTKQVIARFEAERQALAMMDHPNISKVLDAGATETGRPYFVMELVRGIKITAYCDQHNLATRERLDLFVKVCQAIQHAHQKGIIHRDIKPSNILVTVNDGVPVPKVIDFGIAKATQGELTDKTVYTQLQQFIGTPAYMSPEQAEMTSLDIDTRSDIYSLGVLLYELLTGKTPFDPQQLLQSGLDEMRRTIREQEPPRPSTRLSAMLDAELSTTARHQRTEAPKLVHLLRGDVDWIVMKCLEKDRTRRYETANGLAADIQRHLNNEPVVARPPSASYRFQKLVRRNKVVFAAATAVAATLVLAAVVSTLQAVRATRAERDQQRLRGEAEEAQTRESKLRQQAQASEKEATTAAAKANVVTKFLKEMLFAASPGSGRGKGTLLRDVLDDSARKLDDGSFKELPDTEASLRSTVGVTYLSLGLVETARPHLERSMALCRQLYGDFDSRVALSLRNVAYLETNDSRAKQLLTQALEIQCAVVPPDHGEIAHTLGDLGTRERDAPTRQARFREAMKTFQKAGLEESDQATVVLHNLAISIRDSNDPAGAIPLMRQVIGRLKGHRALSDVRAIALRDLAYTLNLVGETEEVESLYRESLSLFRKTVEFEHEDLDDCIFRLTEFLVARGEPAKAEAVLLEQYALLKADPRSTPEAEIMVLQRLVSQYKGWHSGQLPKWQIKLESVKQQSQATKEAEKKSELTPEAPP